eukprot:3302712-Ditylum_brightwellii.AAC.1
MKYTRDKGKEEQQNKHKIYLDWVEGSHTDRIDRASRGTQQAGPIQSRVPAGDSACHEGNGWSS